MMFKEFAMKGSLVNITVALVMGAACKNVVTNFTSGIVTPVVGLIFKGLKYILEKGSVNKLGVLSESPLLCGEF